MARTPQRDDAGLGRWSLLQLCHAANVPRGSARAAVRSGLLPDSGWTINDIPLLRLAHTLLQYPTLNPTRNQLAMTLARGLASSPPTPPQAILVSPQSATLIAAHTTLADLWEHQGATCEPLLLIPFQEWLTSTPQPRKAET